MANNKTNTKANNQHGRINKKVIIFASLALTNVIAVSSVSLAWFITMSSEKNIAAFSGDLDVDIDKITAYKYVYPFYGKSTEIIDYDSAPTLKSYVLEDSNASIGAKGAAKVTEVTFSATKGNGSYVTSPANDVGPKKIHREATLDFSFYLVGDSTFTGVDAKPWSTETGAYFPNVEGPTFTISSVSISRGAEFTIFDKNGCGENNAYSYFTYSSVTGKTGNLSDSPRFSIQKESNNDTEYTKIRCLTSGVYDITYSGTKLTFTASRNGDGLDDAAIGNNILDPTMISIDYKGSASKTIKPGTVDELLYPTIADYLPVAIQKQMTMVVFDVQLTYKNANVAVAGLEVRRGASSQISRAGGYDTASLTDGYQVVNRVVRRNPLDASDFFAFYALFAKQSNVFQGIEASGDNPAKSAAEVLWDAMHNPTNEPGFARFEVSPSYDSVISCELHPKETSGVNADSTLIQPSSGGTTYHCYIGVDYDCEHVPFFLNENRLGKRFLLDRDFGFFFSAKQALKQILKSAEDATSVAVGSTLALTSNAQGEKTWSSADESIATVSSGGVITGVAPGSTTIYARAEGYLDATFDVTVVAAP